LEAIGYGGRRLRASEQRMEPSCGWQYLRFKVPKGAVQRRVSNRLCLAGALQQLRQLPCHKLRIECHPLPQLAQQRRVAAKHRYGPAELMGEQQDP
jgi:hypothetical protein